MYIILHLSLVFIEYIASLNVILQLRLIAWRWDDTGGSTRPQCGSMTIQAWQDISEFIGNATGITIEEHHFKKQTKLPTGELASDHYCYLKLEHNKVQQSTSDFSLTVTPITWREKSLIINIVDETDWNTIISFQSTQSLQQPRAHKRTSSLREFMPHRFAVSCCFTAKFHC